MQVKTISVPGERAQRFESGFETSEDMEWLRRTLAERWPDWIF
jgi:hypothetical protein